MLRRFSLGCLAAGLFVLCLAWVGCSDTTDEIVSSGVQPSTTSEIEMYFPLSRGFTTTYEVTFGDGHSELVGYEVGREVPFLQGTATEWLVRRNGSIADTNYFVISGSALYFFEHKGAAPERVLQLPLDPGRSWDRYAQADVDIVFNGDTTSGGNGDEIDPSDKDDLGLGYDDLEFDTTGSGSGLDLGRSFPTIGSAEVAVETVERVTTRTGEVYSGAVRLRTSGSGDKSNYYWYVPGIGLTKYVLGSTDGPQSEGVEMAELVRFRK